MHVVITCSLVSSIALMSLKGPASAACLTCSQGSTSHEWRPVVCGLVFVLFGKDRFDRLLGDYVTVKSSRRSRDPRLVEVSSLLQIVASSVDGEVSHRGRPAAFQRGVSICLRSRTALPDFGTGFKEVQPSSS